MVFHDGCTADTPEESLLHSTLKADDCNLRRRLQLRRLDIRLIKVTQKAHEFDIHRDLADEQPRSDNTE